MKNIIKAFTLTYAFTLCSSLFSENIPFQADNIVQNTMPAYHEKLIEAIRSYDQAAITDIIEQNNTIDLSSPFIVGTIFKNNEIIDLQRTYLFEALLATAFQSNEIVVDSTLAASTTANDNPSNRWETIKLLIAHGANPNIKFCSSKKFRQISIKEISATMISGIKLLFDNLSMLQIDDYHNEDLKTLQEFGNALNDLDILLNSFEV
ncbi:MAG: hypothetical protein WA432_02565 [Candidatus Babeliaceae bacterium]